MRCTFPHIVVEYSIMKHFPFFNNTFRFYQQEEYFEGETFFSLPLPIAESRSVKGVSKFLQKLKNKNQQISDFSISLLNLYCICCNCWRICLCPLDLYIVFKRPQPVLQILNINNSYSIIFPFKKATIGSCFEAFFAEEEIDCVPCSNCGKKYFVISFFQSLKRIDTFACKIK